MTQLRFGWESERDNPIPISKMWPQIFVTSDKLTPFVFEIRSAKIFRKVKAACNNFGGITFLFCFYEFLPLKYKFS